MKSLLFCTLTKLAPTLVRLAQRVERGINFFNLEDDVDSTGMENTEEKVSRKFSPGECIYYYE